MQSGKIEASPCCPNRIRLRADRDRLNFSFLFFPRSAPAPLAIAEAMQNSISWFVFVALYGGASAADFAQSVPSNFRPPRAIQIQSPQSGPIAGRLTDLHSAPLSGISIVLRNRATGAELHATTTRNGAFQFPRLDVGEYTLEADQPQLGHGTLEGILVTGGVESRVQAAMQFKPAHPSAPAAVMPSQTSLPELSLTMLPTVRLTPFSVRSSIRTQSGSDWLHGQGFLFDRQNTWGAKNPFTQRVQNIGTTADPNFTAAPFTPPDHEITWGLGMGSRIRRDKLFWFAALDGSQRNDPGVPTVKSPAEFFNLPEPTSPAVTLLSAQLGESQNQAYNDFLGVATTGYAPAGLEQLADLLGPAARTTSQWVGFGRIDWQAAERHHFTLEGIGADSSAPGGSVTRVSETYGNHSFGN